MVPPLLVAAAVPAQAVDPKVDACGPPGEQSWLCSTVFNLTESRRAAEVADAFATPLRVVVILLVAYLVVRLLRRLIRRVVRRLESDESQERIDTFRRRTGLSLLDTSDQIPSARRVQRAHALGTVLRSICSIVVWTIAILTCLGELGINLAPLVAGAGIIGVAIGFGAQSLVRDFLSGIFMLVEDQYGVGDVVDAGPAIGTVEVVTLRTTRLRDVEGVVWHIPNGEIKRIGNKSQQWSRAVLDLPVAYATDLSNATTVIKRVADEMWHDEQFRDLVLAEPEVWGVEELAAEGLLIRLVVKTRPLEQWRVARELRARIKAAFEEAGIEMFKT
jgi:small-conductance mechanosensitive channel